MNIFLIVISLVILLILGMAVYSRRQQTDAQTDAADASKSSNTKPKHVEKLSPHDAAVWLDEFLVKQQKDIKKDSLPKD